MSRLSRRQFVLLNLQDQTLAIDTRRVINVMPLYVLHRSGQLRPPCVGNVEYRDQAVPVLDVSLLASGVPSKQALSTRVIVVRGADEIPLGLEAEGVTEIVKVAEQDIVVERASLPGNLDVEAVFHNQGKKVYVLDLERLARMDNVRHCLMAMS